MAKAPESIMNMKRWFFCYIATCLFNVIPVYPSDSSTANNNQGLDIIYVRHAETIANATGDYTTGNESTFSEKGEVQRYDLIEKLAPYSFDAILCSPRDRVVYTLLPYLEEQNLKAEIWPELTECCWHKDRSAPVSEDLEPGPPILLAPDAKRYFAFRDNEARNEYQAFTYADGIVQMNKLHDLITECYAGSGKTILVAGHGLAGSRFIELLIGQTPNGHIRLHNSELTHIKQMSDGSFKLISINGHPFKGTYY